MSPAEVAERLAAFERQLLPFPPFEKAKEAIEEVLFLHRQSGLVRHMLVLGEAGCGKTSLGRWVESLHPMQRFPELDVRPVLFVSAPPTSTLAGLVEAFLRALGDPEPTRGSVAAKAARVLVLCRNCHVELILLDEGQHLLDRGGSKTHYLFGDWIKDLIDQLATPMVILGLPRLQALLQTNEQLRRRFSRRLWLAIGEDGEETIESQCLTLAVSLASYIELPVDPQPYSEQEFGVRIYRACDGRVAYIKKLLFSAVRMALEGDFARLDVAMLEAAFIEEIWSDGINNLNPFHPQFELRRLDRRGEPFETPLQDARRGR